MTIVYGGMKCAIYAQYGQPYDFRSKITLFLYRWLRFIHSPDQIIHNIGIGKKSYFWSYILSI